MCEESEEMEMASIKHSFEKFGCERGEKIQQKFDAKIGYSEGFLIGRRLSEFEC